jgi:hypothetical protein
MYYTIERIKLRIAGKLDTAELDTIPATASPD